LAVADAKIPRSAGDDRRVIDFSKPVMAAVVVLLAIMIVLPMGWLAVYAFATKDGQATLGNFVTLFTDPSFVDRYNLFILEAKRIWIDESCKERRTMHHRGDGSFTVDGGTLDLRKRMVKWRHLP